MGKKGRRTKWRKLSMGDSSGPDDEEDEGVVLSGEGTWRETPPYLRSSSGGSGPGSLSPDILRDGKRIPRYWNSRDGYTCPVRTQCKTFGNEEYTIISTPRQEVLFKKGSIARKKPEQQDTRPPSSQAGEESHYPHDCPENGVQHSLEGLGTEGRTDIPIEHQQPFMCYPVCYDMYGNGVSPYMPYGSQFLPTVMLQPMQWYDKQPGEQMYYYALMYPTPVIPEGGIPEEGKIIEEEEEESVGSCCRRGSLSSQACCSSSLPDQDNGSISSPGTSQGPSSPQVCHGTPSTTSASPQLQEFVPLSSEFARLTCNVSVPPPPIIERPHVEASPPPRISERPRVQATLPTPLPGYVHPSYKNGPPSVYTEAQKPSTPTRHRSPPILTVEPLKPREPRPPLPPGLTRRQRRNRKKRRELEEEWEAESVLLSAPDTETTSLQFESQTANQKESSLAENLKSSDDSDLGNIDIEPAITEETGKVSEVASLDEPGPEQEPESEIIPGENSVVTQVTLPESEEQPEVVEVEAEIAEPECSEEVEESECTEAEESEFEELQTPIPTFELDLPDDLPFDPAELGELDSQLEGWGCVDLGLPKKLAPVLSEAVNETKTNHFLGYTGQGDATTLCSSVTEKSCSVISERDSASELSGDETMVVPLLTPLVSSENLSDSLDKTCLGNSDKDSAKEAVTAGAYTTVQSALAESKIVDSLNNEIPDGNGNVLSGAPLGQSTETKNMPSQRPLPESQSPSLHQSSEESVPISPDHEKAQLGPTAEPVPPPFNENDNHTPQNHVVDDTYQFGSASGTPYHSLLATPIKGQIERENLNMMESGDSLSDSLEKMEGSTSGNVSSLSASFEADSLEDKEELNEDYGEEIDEEFLFEKPKPKQMQIWKTVILEETETETSESEVDRIRTYSCDTDSDEILRIELPDKVTSLGEGNNSFFLHDEEFLDGADLISSCELTKLAHEIPAIEKGTITQAVSQWLSTVPPEESVIIPDSELAPESDSESETEDQKNEFADPRTAPSLEDDPQRRVEEEEFPTVNCNPNRYSQYYQLGVFMSDEEGDPRPSPPRENIMTDSGIDASSTDSDKPTHKTNSLRKRFKSTLKRTSWRRNSKAITAELNRGDVPFEKLKRGQQHCCSLQ